MDYIKKLISISSHSGHEAHIQAYIADELKKFNVSPYFVGKNLVVKIPGRNKKKSLLFNAHVDTVSAGAEELWNWDPLTPVVQNEKIYGLGASDEKSGVASLIDLAKIYSNTIPSCDIWLHFVVNEEIDGSGTNEVMSWFEKNQRKQYESIAGILVEPTGLEEVCIGHKGNIFVKLTSHGESGHGSMPEKIKRHSVMVMFQAFETVRLLEKKWNRYSDLLLGSASIGLATSITAGNVHNANQFPDTCVATVDVRTVPQMHERAVGDILQALHKLKVDVTLLYPPALYGRTVEDDPIVQVAQSLLPTAHVCAFSGSTDQCFFTERNIPAIIVGPGEKSCMHRENEYCFIEKINTAVSLYRNIVNVWGNVSSK